MQALVLAGARATGDPLCEAEGVSSKAVIDIAGAPMLSHVMQAITQSGLTQTVWILGGEGEDLTQATGGIAFEPLPATGAGPADSLATALRGPVPLPLLVTTADHPLLTPEMIRHFLDGAEKSGADICIGFAKRDTIQAAYPDTRRTYLPIGERDMSGCNLFYLGSEAAIGVLEFWRTVERHRKNPLRIARGLGFGFLLRFFLQRNNTDRVFEALTNRLGATIKPVILPFAEAAIDVDSPKDLAMVREIFAKRTG